jgi:hypothetical protein
MSPAMAECNRPLLSLVSSLPALATTWPVAFVVGIGAQIGGYNPVVRSALYFVVCVGLISGCVSRETRRVHAENMAKAEGFKREFDQHLAAGASREAVDTYLAAHQVKISNVLGPEGTGDGFLELTTEKSTSWYCGEAKVGLLIHFTANRLDRVTTAGWSWDCP